MQWAWPCFMPLPPWLAWAWLACASQGRAATLTRRWRKQASEMPWKHQLAGNSPYIKAGHCSIGAYSVAGCGTILTNPDGLGGDAA